MKKIVLFILLTITIIACKKGTTETPTPTPCPQKPAIGVALPNPIDYNNKTHLSEIQTQLTRIKNSLPSTTYSFVVFSDQLTDSSDWKAVLDIYQAIGVKAIVAFYDDVNDEAFRPRPITPGNWNVSNLGKFIQNNACINHPALMAVAMVDEPFEYMNTALLHDLYLYCKNLNSAANYKIMVNHSRQLYKKIHTSQGGIGTDPQRYWRDELCDIVNISTLEFGLGKFDTLTLDSTHFISRQVIKNITPNLPLYTTVQTFGSQYGASNVNNYFPTAPELTRMLQLVTDNKYQSVYPLTGITFQSWSRKYSSNTSQWVLGSELNTGTPVTRQQTNTDLINAINAWLKDCR